MTTKKVMWLAGAAVVLLVLASLFVQGLTGAVYAQDDEGEIDIFLEDDELVAEEGGEPLEEVTPLSELVEDPEQFEDEEVTLTDSVGATFGRRAFALGQDDQEVLIFTTDPEGFPSGLVRRGARLRVVGEAGVFDRAAFEEEFGVSVTRRFARRFAEQPFVVAGPADVEAAAEADVVVEPEVEAVVTPQAEVAVSPEVEVVVTPEADVVVTPEANVAVRPEADVEVQPEVELDLTPEVDIFAQPEVDIGVTPEVIIEVQPEVEIAVTPNVQVAVTPNVQVETESEVAVEAADADVDVEAAEEEVGVSANLRTVVLVDEEGNQLGQARFTTTRRGRLLLELTSNEFDPTTQYLAIVPAAVCEAPDFEMGDEETILDLSGFDFQEVGTLGENDVEANEFFTLIAGFDTSQLTGDEGGALAVHRGRSARSDIIACGVIDEGLAAEQG
ncbi:MAG: hypothetical protein M3220_11490 [Chloroflexota bacterium]|nr:hypothetical protein [Chloroflexota bacterium]